LTRENTSESTSRSSAWKGSWKSWSPPGTAVTGGEHGRRARGPNATMIGPTGGLSYSPDGIPGRRCRAAARASPTAGASRKAVGPRRRGRHRPAQVEPEGVLVAGAAPRSCGRAVEHDAESLDQHQEAQALHHISCPGRDPQAQVAVLAVPHLASARFPRGTCRICQRGDLRSTPTRPATCATG
jgi:hypothetical protein